MKKWYQLTSDEESADLYLFGDITEYKWYESDVSAFDMAKELGALGAKPLNVHINSYGGEVKEGIGIYNLLKNYSGPVTTINDGFACSAASVIFMAGEKRVMPQTSLLMIHNAWSYGYGDANALRKKADELDKVTEPSIKAYLEAGNLPYEDIKKMMDEETWLTADEALAYGFATEICDDDQAMQSIQDQTIRSLVLHKKQLESTVSDLSEQLENLKNQSSENDHPAQKGWFFHGKN